MEEGKIIIGGDLNARTGRGSPFFNEEGKVKRNSKDKVKNTEGTKLIEMVEENGCEILNGNIEGDEIREFTFIGGKGNSVIDYVMIDSLMKDKIKSFRIEDRVESDHLPMVMEIYGRTEKEKKKEEQWKKKKVWTEEGKRHYQGCVPLNAHNVRDHDRKISRSTSSRSPRAKVLVERSADAVSDINMAVVKQVATALLMRRRKYETDSSSSSDDDWEITLRERV